MKNGYSVVIGTALIALVVACQDQTMTGVERSARSATPRFTIENSAADNARLAIDDAATRMAPALSDTKAATGLVAALTGLQQAVDAGRAADAPGLARTVATELDQYARATNADGAELDAIRLALASVTGQ